MSKSKPLFYLVRYRFKPRGQWHFDSVVYETMERALMLGMATFYRPSEVQIVEVQATGKITVLK